MPREPSRRSPRLGCGCGRILRWLQALHPEWQYRGTDIDGEAIAWCRENLSGIGTYRRNEAMPPLPFPDGCFDFVYSISIFSHLPEDMEFRWLEELNRVTKPGGFLLLTVHGESLFPTDSTERLRRFREAGFCYWVGSGTPGLPSFYQTSFHTDAFLRRRWAEILEIVDIRPQGIANHQDAVVCRRRA